MAIIQLELGSAMNDDTSSIIIADLHAKHLQTAKDFMAHKTHDYGAACREMSVSSFTDMILNVGFVCSLTST